MITPTQKDIAKEAGITQSAVSLALRNHPSISVKMRQRIHKIAVDLGYQLNPYLAGLAAYRRKRRPVQFRGTLAWFSSHSTPGFPKCWVGYLKGATARAGELGYTLEEFKLKTPSLGPVPFSHTSVAGLDGFNPNTAVVNAARTRRILLSRNVSGILVGPQPEAGAELDFDFDGFSAVTIGYSLVKPRLHMVVQQQFRCMVIAFRKLLDLGYRRPGLVIDANRDERTEHHWSAAFASEQKRLPAENRIAPLEPEEVKERTFLKWYRSHRPDVILAPCPAIFQWLVDAGLSIPEDVGIALFNVPDEGAFFSGISENAEVIGARAVELLVDMIHRGEKGIPDVHAAMHIGGKWVDGKTVRLQR